MTDEIRADLPFDTHFISQFLGTILEIIYVPGKTATKQVHENASMKVHCMARAKLVGGPINPILRPIMWNWRYIIIWFDELSCIESI